MKRFFMLFTFFAVILLSGCGVDEIASSLAGGEEVPVAIVYGSEKREWLEPLIEEYNQAGHQTADGATIVVSAQPMGSIEAINGIISQEIKPTVWSPASSVYLPVAEEEWRKQHSTNLAYGEINDLVLSPVIIAMWQPMAEALGWPDEPIGWTDIVDLAGSEEGWNQHGYPEWGQFKLGHTHPGFSNSGLVSILAETYARAGKTRDLTMDDVINPEVENFVARVESSRFIGNIRASYKM